jgi:hypothetical protein
MEVRVEGRKVLRGSPLLYTIVKKESKEEGEGGYRKSLRKLKKERNEENQKNLKQIRFFLEGKNGNRIQIIEKQEERYQSWWSKKQRELGFKIPMEQNHLSSRGGLQMVYEKLYQEDLKKKSVKGLPVWGAELGTLPFKRTLKMGDSIGLLVQIPQEHWDNVNEFIQPKSTSQKLNEMILMNPDHPSKKIIIHRKAEVQKKEKEIKLENLCSDLIKKNEFMNKNGGIKKEKEEEEDFLGMQKPYVVRYLKEKEKGVYRGQSTYDHIKKQNAIVMVSKEWELKLNEYGYRLLKLILKPEVLGCKLFEFKGMVVGGSMVKRDLVDKKEKRRGLDWNSRTGHLLYHAAPFFQYNAMEKFYQLDKHAIKTEYFIRKNRPQTMLEYYGEVGRSSNLFKGWKPTWLRSKPHHLLSRIPFNKL